MHVTRSAERGDLAEIREIYAHWVNTGLSSFEEIAPEVDEIEKRWQEVLDDGLPYLVVEIDNRVAGYAYAQPYKTRSAYRYTVEDSVYVHPEFHRHGVGKSLLAAVIEACESMGFRQMVAIIGDGGQSPSVDLHTACGFSYVGTLEDVGWKFGRSVDTVIMQLALGVAGST